MKLHEARELLQLEPIRLRDRQIQRVAAAADIADLQRAAHRYWPVAVRDYVDGGADGEISLDRNRQAFLRQQLTPSVLVDVETVDTECTILGTQSAMPFALGPTGYSRMMHPQGETAVARAASRAGIPYTVATMSTVAIEELPVGAHWFQLYMWRDKSVVDDLLVRAERHGCTALMLTVDTAVTGHRLRDTRNGFALPPRLTLSTIAGMARRPRWGLGMLTGDPISFANIRAEFAGEAASVMDFAAKQFDSSVDWANVQWLRERWGGRLVIKGVLSPDDATCARAAGADAVVVSNHGGRQLDQTVAPLDALASIRRAVGDEFEVLLDSGVRRGTDIAIALASGADAVLIGRPYLYGLGAGGEYGVDRAIDILGTELGKAMRLLGVRSIPELRERGAKILSAELDPAVCDLDQPC